MKKYEHIANEIRKEIENNLDMEKLPTELELMEKYDVSRDTIRSAFQKLKSEDIIYSKRGSGHYVKKDIPQIKNLLNTYFTITEMFENSGLEIGKRNETIEMLHTDQFSQYFGDSTEFFVIQRVRTAVNQAIAFSRIILPVDMVGKKFPLKYRSGSLKDFLKDDLGLGTVETYTRIEAFDKKKDAIPKELHELPIIKLTQDHRLKRGKTLLLTEDYIRSDVIEMYVYRVPHALDH